MAADVIRNARIVVHLEQGKVLLRVPDLAPFIRQQERAVELTRQLAEESRRLNSTQTTSPGAATGGASGGDAAVLDFYRQQLALLKQIEDQLKRTASAASSVTFSPGGGGGGSRGDAGDKARRQADAFREMQTAAQQSLGALGRLGEGSMRLGRAFVLLGVSTEGSMGAVIRGLARVQAYFDILKGGQQIVSALIALEKAAAAAKAAYVTATVGATAAQKFFTIAVLETTRALAVWAVALAPYIALVVALALAYDALTTSEAEAREEAERHVAAEREQLDLMQQQAERLREIAELRREAMAPADRRDAALAEAEHAAKSAEFGSRFASNTGGLGELDSQRAAMSDAQAAKRLYDEALRAERERVDAAKEIADAKIREIEAQERIVDIAKRALEIEERKRDAFRVQFGMLSQIEQQELKRIADKLRAGQDINQFEEQFIAERGGSEGQNIANARRGRRGEAAGADSVFDGIADAGNEMKEASDAVADALKELAKLLGGADNPAAAKAKLEAEKKALEEQYKDFYKKNAEAVGKLVDLMSVIEKKIQDLELALLFGT